ncbi:MAG: hypothetical protein KDI98_00150 [Hyphomicrobiaceae bacterium]|nr:hypothetical protein [Hyphomicrobiaceae bacterium]
MRRLIAGAVCALITALPAGASPFGSGPPAETPLDIGPDSWVRYLAGEQARFLRALSDGISAIADRPEAAFGLILIAFIYGVLHAAGPGHGKAVISSYVLATRDTVRRGILLAVLSSLLQGTVAVLAVAILAGVFGVAATTMNSAVLSLERLAFFLLALLGGWLVWKKAVLPLTRFLAARRVGTRHDHPHHHDPHHHDHGHHHHDHHHHHHDHEHGPDCGCGHAHAPDAQAAAGVRDVKGAFGVVIAAGIRPCSGAIVVLVLALAGGVFWAGVAAAYAMAAGTALTVGTLAAGASGLVHLAERGGARWARLAAFVLRAAEIAGAFLVLALGLLLLAASFS